MIKIDIEFRKGILFLRLGGNLEKSESKEFRNKVFPIILKGGFKYIVLNCELLNTINQNGLDTFYDLQKIVKENYGRISLCNLNNINVKNIIERSYINDFFYKAKNELSSLEVFKI